MHYLAWPFVAGETLEKVVQTQGKLTPSRAAHYILQVVEGLEVCHQQALFHGLLKPSNLMVDTEHQMHILDFGIGCLLAETEGESLVDTMSTANSVASGLDCASPESIMDPTNLTPSGDQYSLGCILYYCVTGQYPFPDGSSAEKMMAHQFKEPTPIRDLNPDVPKELIEVVERLMQKVPENRYASVAEVVEALRPLAEIPGAGPAQRPGPRVVAVRPAGGARPAIQPAPAAPAAETRPAAVCPSTPTPKPQSSVVLPSRQSMRGSPAPAAAKAQTRAAAQPPIGEVENSSMLRPWDEKLGPAGIGLIALVVCLVAFVAVKFIL
jgi:serine/threonine protein kinase